MQRKIESLVYAAVIVLTVAALSLFAALPRLSLITALVYQGF